MATQKKSPTWLKDLLVAFAATTLSIILTFGTTGVINRVKQKQERKLTALMVMSSIEQFARDLELIEKDMAYRDSIAAWLLSIPVKDVAKLGDEPFKEALQEVYDLALINRDKTAETIFSSHIDTWRNMGNFKFIDNVGWCFSYMDYIEKTFNTIIVEIQESNDDIIVHPENYPGSSMVEKYLRNKQVRNALERPHKLRRLLSYTAANLRMENRNNMRLIDIKEKEVMDFADNLGAADEYENETLNQFDFEKPAIDVDSVALHLSFARQVDSLLHAK